MAMSSSIWEDKRAKLKCTVQDQGHLVACKGGIVLPDGDKWNCGKKHSGGTRVKRNKLLSCRQKTNQPTIERKKHDTKQIA
jgi:hypothetical protein